MANPERDAARLDQAAEQQHCQALQDLIGRMPHGATVESRAMKVLLQRVVRDGASAAETPGWSWERGWGDLGIGTNSSR
jgi:hypothetical protein